MAAFSHCIRYIDALCVSATVHSEFHRLGGKLILRTLTCLSEVHSFIPDVSLIINCSGLGAGTLVDDNQVFPVAGHIVKVVSPTIKHFYMDSENTTYIFPRAND